MSRETDDSKSGTDNQRNDAFALKDCALIAIATGKRAFTLKELRDQMLTIAPDSIYHHFWGSLLEPRFEQSEYNNDFAAWARGGLHDGILAERLAMVDPALSSDLEELRQELLDIIEERIDESESLPWLLATESFEFIRSQIVVFDTYKRIERPEQLAQLLPHLSTSSIFYHFIDARRRLSEGCDDFQLWVSGFDGLYRDLAKELAAIDPYFVTLSELRQQLTMVFSRYCTGGVES
jgi:hypothetical protein